MFTKTTNGAGALMHTGDNLVNLFFNVGASRANQEGIRKDFLNALATDKTKATAILLWTRDIRHDGAGERQTFRTLLKDLIEFDQLLAAKVIVLIPEIGRFDDLRTAFGTKFEEGAAAYWASFIKAGNVLAAKWAKREDKPLQKALGLNEAGLRKLLAKLRKEHIVEAKMCNKDWDKIEYDKIPSIAALRYAAAFRKNDAERYAEFIGDTTKSVNMSAAFPYDVYRMYKGGKCQNDEIQKYWDALPDLGIKGKILPMVDVSLSMTWVKVAGILEPLDIAIGLGVYCSQKIEGRFNGKVLTFETTPHFVDIKGLRAVDAFNKVSCAGVGGSTDVQAAYRLLLDSAKLWNVPAEDMPDYILIMSDMQFNQAQPTETSEYTKKGWVSRKLDKPETIYANMGKEFEAAGYKLPKIVFWNLNAGYENFPTISFQTDTALVSGFSPNILKAVVKAEDVKITPQSVMEEAIAPFIEMLN